MARFSVAEARRQFSRLLDVAEQGEDVVLERRGVRFRLIVEADADASSEPTGSPLIVADADVMAGQWTWTAADDGQLQFQRLPADPDA